MMQKAKRNEVINPSQYKGQFVLSGIIRCPECGGGTVMAKGRKRNEEGYHLYYKCQNYHSKGLTACRTNLIKKEVVEAQVFDLVRKMIKHPTIVEGLLLEAQKTDVLELTEIEQGLAFQKKELKDRLDKQDKLLDSHLSGMMSPHTFQRKNKDLEQEIAEIEKDIESLSMRKLSVSHPLFMDKDNLLEQLESFTEVYEHASQDQKRKLMKALIKEIQMTADRKQVKSITFWFAEFNPFITDGSTSSELGGTVP